MKKLSILCVAAGSLIAVGSLASAATIVQNGSFEEDIATTGQNGNTFSDMPISGGSWDIWASPDVPGWTTPSLPQGVEIQTERTLGLTPYDGLYYAELDTNENSEISQIVNLSQGRYELSFAYSPRIDVEPSTTNKINVALDHGFLSAVSADINGPDATTSVGTWTVFTYDFVIGEEVAGDYVLTFDAGGTSDSLGGFIDGIEINAVPLPAGAFLLLGGLGGLAAMRRRKKVA